MYSVHYIELLYHVVVYRMQMAHVLFHEAGLMETFQIPQRQFVNYFRALEANYGSNVCKSTRTHLQEIAQ